jgi:hypothetical protein
LSTNPVTNKNIKDDAVPPALIEVRQHMVECYLHTISPPAELSKLRIFIQGQCLQHMKKHSFSFIEKDIRCFTCGQVGEKGVARGLYKDGLASPPLWL